MPLPRTRACGNYLSSMTPLETYLHELRDIRSTGAGVEEESYYHPLSEVGPSAASSRCRAGAWSALFPITLGWTGYRLPGCVNGIWTPSTAFGLIALTVTSTRQESSRPKVNRTRVCFRPNSTRKAFRWVRRLPCWFVTPPSRRQLAPPSRRQWQTHRTRVHCWRVGGVWR